MLNSMRNQTALAMPSELGPPPKKRIEWEGGAWKKPYPAAQIDTLDMQVCNFYIP